MLACALDPAPSILCPLWAPWKAYTHLTSVLGQKLTARSLHSAASSLARSPGPSEHLPPSFPPPNPLAPLWELSVS